jgi:hypothetical protein
MNDQFDELAKGLARSVTRREALKQFGLGLAGIALATLGLANNAEATRGSGIHYNCQCKKLDFGCGKSRNPQECLSQCGVYCSQRHAQ